MWRQRLVPILYESPIGVTMVPTLDASERTGLERFCAPKEQKISNLPTQRDLSSWHQLPPALTGPSKNLLQSWVKRVASFRLVRASPSPQLLNFACETCRRKPSVTSCPRQFFQPSRMRRFLLVCLLKSMRLRTRQQLSTNWHGAEMPTRNWTSFGGSWRTSKSMVCPHKVQADVSRP